MGEPHDVALTVRAIADGVLDYSTGQVINVDGGFRLRLRARQLMQTPNDVLCLLLVSSFGVRQTADHEPLQQVSSVRCGLQLVEQPKRRRRIRPAELLGAVDIGDRPDLRMRGDTQRQQQTGQQTRNAPHPLRRANRAIAHQLRSRWRR